MRTVLITGISGSLGVAMAAHFLSRGECVLGLDLRPPELPGGSSGRIGFRQCDLSDPEQIETAVGELVSEHSPTDVVINNAGIIFNSPLLRLETGRLVKHDFAQWRQVIDVTLNAAFYVTACCAAAMASSAKKGVILNVGSICAAGNLGQPAYSAAKAGLTGLTGALAKELGPLGIRVAAIAPGYIDTESTRSNVSPEALGQIRKRTPTRKLGTTDQFLEAVDFVIENAYFNGKVLELDGGLTL